MKRSVYSLVLMDDVIRAVDEQAYRLGTSRSNLINQILAEQLSCVTPEMRMRDIFGCIEELIGGAMQVQRQRSASLMTMRTALAYKYRPTISYKIELDRVPAEFLGTLRVQIRTQSERLTDEFNRFFEYRVRIERGQLAALGYEYPEWRLTDGCFSRKLLNVGGVSDIQAGEAIGRYIADLDFAVKAYFAAPDDFVLTSIELARRYGEMLKNCVI